MEAENREHDTPATAHERALSGALPGHGGIHEAQIARCLVYRGTAVNEPHPGACNAYETGECAEVCRAGYCGWLPSEPHTP